MTLAHPDLDDLLCHEAINQPYDFYGRLRETDPVHFNERWNGWIVTSYEHVAAGYRDHDRLSSDRFEGPFAEEWKPGGEAAHSHAALLEFLSKFFVWKDPPYHTRVRRLVSRAFTARNVDSVASGSVTSSRSCWRRCAAATRSTSWVSSRSTCR